jgi:general secretion pathway protein E
MNTHERRTGAASGQETDRPAEGGTRQGESLDFKKLHNYTVANGNSPIEEMNLRNTEISPDLRATVKAYMERQGYSVSEGKRLTGKSGVEHAFDMIAVKDDGLTTFTVAICIILGSGKEAEGQTIFTFANNAFDTGIQGRVIIAIPDLSPEARQLANKQRIKVIQGTQVDALLRKETAQPAPPRETLKFDTREQLVRSLDSLGYHVEENARIYGRSGVEYRFDILGYANTDQVSHSLGIDFFSSERLVSLEQISVFDTKAFEVGIDNKIIVVSSLSPEAEQFAQHQKIRVLKLPKPGDRKMPEPEKAGERTAKAGKKAEPADPQAKRLKQQAQPEALLLVPEVMARRYNAFPVSVSGNTLNIAMADPTDIFALEAFSALTKMRIKPAPANAAEVREAIDFNYKSYGEIEKQLSLVSIPTDGDGERMALSTDTDSPLVQALNLIVDEAVKARASDIHIEPELDRVRVRYRIDGTLQDLMSLPLNINLALISRIKILSNLNIADRHRPQDGQFSVNVNGRDIDVRVATTPTVNGEMAVLRLLDKSVATLGLSQLGMLPECLAKYEGMLKTPYGMILTSGPTGAGKTTTMYASINSLDTLGRNIITIEDPAEYRFKDINQIQVNNQAGITFATGLRSILRLDPDVILIGEIRDAETANIAIQAAMTGHLMLSSVHAQDAATVLSRLLDLGIESFLVASAVIGVIGQRMVRRICPDCSRPIEAPKVEQLAYERETGEKRTDFLYGTGCKACSYTGYLGRTGIFEILLVTDAIRTMISNRVNSGVIRAQAIREDGMVTMMKDGMHKVRAGITNPAEILRSAYSPE